MRKGPHPLAVHLGMAAANMSGIQRYAKNIVSHISENDAVQMVRGITMYQEHSYVPKLLPSEEVWRDGGISIKKPIQEHKAKVISKTPLLLVPSLINKANILDISEERSMLRWFNDNGIETYLLDWGDFSGEHEKNIDISELIEVRLCEALRAVSKIADSQIDVLGYCMGGTMLLLSHAFASSYIRRMTLLASPWDFCSSTSGLAQNVRMWSPSVLPIVGQRGHLPSEWVQALFASLDPNGSAQKFIDFASMDQNGSRAELFISVEDWLNDGVDLPKDVAQHCIQDWFVDNKLISGKICIGCDVIDIEKIDADILVLASTSDRLVPFDCAANVQKNLPRASVEIIELNCGHIGLIVGRNAVETVWTPILDWLNRK